MALRLHDADFVKGYERKFAKKYVFLEQQTGPLQVLPQIHQHSSVDIKDINVATPSSLAPEEVRQIQQTRLRASVVE
jgi:hypothetical protein